jgi:hypothetical protein
VDTRPVLRIFISSTATDLTSYREHVRDAVLRLENLPIQMETFSAMPGQPVAECMRMAAQADAVVCIVAHRYGYVPPVELGGDGERSITWLEVDAARRAGKPVFAFLVDPQAPWTAAKEQDRLVNEPEKAAEIIKSVQKLKEFKEYLSSQTTRQLFSDPHQLDAQVTAALSQFQPQTTPSTARVWRPLVCHALQPAPHFRGRASIVKELKEWLVSPVTPDRVFSLVAAGGTGKTAIVNEAFHQASFSGQAGVFVWSFYEDARTDNFLRAAYLYFTGKDDAPPGGMLERLQMVLSGDAPHVLILDGLERAQTDEGTRRRGKLDDPQLERLLRSLAGGLGNARALVTSRFPLVDLDDFKGAGHRAVMLDDLDRENALAVLRAWGLKGDDATLTHIVEPLNIQGTYSALSVAALGSYLGSFSGPIPQFSLADAKQADKPAFSFRVDPRTPWIEANEQNRLVDEPERAAEILEAVQKLEELKEYLSRHRVRQLFSDPHQLEAQLEAQVTAALSNLKSHGHSLRSREGSSVTSGAPAFLSYSREDSNFVLRLAGDLKVAGAIVWLDQLEISPGEPWDRAVQDALTRCSRLLVILSPASVKSEHVMDEVSFALEEGKTVIPVIHRDCTIPFRLRRLQHADFRQDYDRGAQSLLKVLIPGHGA